MTYIILYLAMIFPVAVLANKVYEHYRWSRRIEDNPTPALAGLFWPISLPIMIVAGIVPIIQWGFNTFERTAKKVSDSFKISITKK